MSIITNLIIKPIYEIYNYCKPFIINYTEYIYNNNIDLIDNNIDLIDNNKKRILNIRSNTTNDLYNYNNKIKLSKSNENILISKDIIWICFKCKYKIPYYKDLYCSNDKIFCCANCRDNFLINKINNNI